jgi:hypothetical protein
MSKNLTKLAFAAAMAVGLGSMSRSWVRGAEPDEGTETKVKLTDCPAAVQTTITSESAGAKTPVTSVDKQTQKDGTVIYEADAEISGVNYEIQVSPDGKLIVKKIDSEESEKKSDGKDKEEKDDKK